jgi:hypothetical protein
VPASKEEWNKQTQTWKKQLEEHCFRGWPTEEFPPGEGLDLKEAFSVAKNGTRFLGYDFTSQNGIRLRLYLIHPDGLEMKVFENLILVSLDDEGWHKFVGSMQPTFPKQFSGEIAGENNEEFLENIRSVNMLVPSLWAFVAPRGVGPTAWKQDERTQTQIQRRFMLMGQTWHGMQVWDVRRALQALRKVKGDMNAPVFVAAERDASGIALYATLFEPNIREMELRELKLTHRKGPIFLNVLRFLDMPVAIALAAEKAEVAIVQTDKTGWEYPEAVSKALGWKQNRFRIRPIPPTENQPPDQ